MSHPVTVTVSAYNISILPDTNINYSAWLIQVESVGGGNWCVRHHGRQCLTKRGDWIWEPLNSSKGKLFLSRTRWDNAEDAIAAAVKAAPKLTINGLTADDVLARVQRDKYEDKQRADYAEQRRADKDKS